MARILLVCLLFLTLASNVPTNAQSGVGDKKSSSQKGSDATPAKAGDTETKVEKYLRNLYAWGPAYEVKIGSPKPSPVPDLLEIPVTVSMGDQSDTAVVYLSKDGKFLIRGELSDMSADPFADALSKLNPGTSPSLGPSNAKITLIEFADFECPVCRQLDLILRDLLPKHPEIRLVFKHYPLTDIHPWAMTAAIATQCAYQQNPAAFWKMHDAIFDAQEVISPSNVWDKMIDLGTQQGLNQEEYKACMSRPDTAEKIKQTIAEGRAVNVSATPTTFINGRRFVGPNKSLLEQYLAFLTPTT